MLWLGAGATSVPRRLGLRPEKCASGGCAHGARSGSGRPRASAQSVGPPGAPEVSGESAPPRLSAPPAHFSDSRSGLAASRRWTDVTPPPSATCWGSLSQGDTPVVLRSIATTTAAASEMDLADRERRGPQSDRPSRGSRWRHAYPSSFGRTSDQGTAESGLSTCSAHRRSSSARCASVRGSWSSRSASLRLAQSAIASSARSPAGN